ncbi:hypothetical protein GF380_06650, partial [Candidatus Uhrbacteria bacterium]|nr:hypothetical protein [Candidatus Uhrbacteria bacterium]
MAQTWESRRLRNEREVDNQLIEDMVGLGVQAGRLFVGQSRADENGRRVVPNNRQVRANLSLGVWEQVIKPYFIGTGNEA